MDAIRRVRDGLLRQHDVRPDGPRPAVAVYDHVRQHIPPEGPGLLEGGDDLPDESLSTGPIRWAAGAQDGVATHHFGLGTSRDVKRISKAIRRAVGGDADAFEALERMLRGVDVVSLADPLLETGLPGTTRADVHALGMRLATTSPYREAVKLGIALIGATGDDDDRELLLTLGRSDELTLFCAVALGNSSPLPDAALWDLARSVTGWGRVQTVERLRDTADPRIREWILREGFRNSVMDEYLAYIAATTGDLAGALEDEAADDELLDAAGDIISALVAGGPVEDIDDYSDAPRAIDGLLRHLESGTPTVHRLIAVTSVERFLSTRAETWPVDRRSALLARSRSILARPEWRERTSAGLRSDDPIEFHEAERAARALGMDTFEANLRQIRSQGIEGPWFEIMQVVDEGHVDTVMELAAATLPLEEIASGPADELGLGREFAPHGALVMIVQELGRFPGHGWELLRTALRSPVVNNRNMALDALEAWGADNWPPEAVPVLEASLKAEPVDELRSRIRSLLDSSARMQ